MNIMQADADTSDEIFERLSELDRSVIPDGWSAESFRSEAAKDGGFVLYIEENDKICALLTGYSVVGEGDITNVAVAPGYRRRGLAVSLIKAFENMLGDSAEKIFLEVRESNQPAVGLYKKCGFKAISLRKNFYANPRENAIVMVKEN